jgi:hypothetical protein
MDERIAMNQLNSARERQQELPFRAEQFTHSQCQYGTKSFAPIQNAVTDGLMND